MEGSATMASTITSALSGFTADLISVAGTALPIAAAGLLRVGRFPSRS